MTHCSLYLGVLLATSILWMAASQALFVEGEISCEILSNRAR